MRRIAILFLLVFLAASAQGWAQQTSTVRPGFDGIFEAFQAHPLVGLGEDHRRAQEIDFYTALIRDPRFAREVGNVVVEFGGAAHQDIIDRYVSGEDVPYRELRKVWTDTVGWTGVVPSMGYQLFFYQVREVNLTLPPQNRIHVWLGEPVIDWSKIQTHAEWDAIDRLRDSRAAELIEREILARGRKALVIYGAGHFYTALPTVLIKKFDDAGWDTYTLRARLDQTRPGALFTVLFYTGAGDKSCIDDFEHNVSNAWTVPTFIAPLRGSEIAGALRHCNAGQASNFVYPPGLSGEEKQEAASYWLAQDMASDALIYVGPRAQLAFAPTLSDYFMDTDYFHEIARHYFLQTGQKLDPPNRADYPMSPRYPNH